MDVWQHTSLSNGNVAQELVEFLVVSDGKLQVTGDNTGLFVVSGCVSSQFQDFSTEIFQDGSEVDWGSSTDTLGIVSLSQQTMDTTDWELQSSSARSRFRCIFA